MADEELQVESGGGSKKKLILLVLAGLFLVGGSAGGALFFAGVLTTPAEQSADAGDGEASATEAPKPAVYVALDPAFTVNFSTPGPHRFLQISLEALTRDPDVEDAIRQHMPMIRNKLLLLFGSKSSTELASRSGKEKLQGEALAAVQNILTTETGDKGVESVFFTSFVMQ